MFDRPAGDTGSKGAPLSLLWESGVASHSGRLCDF
jgi:hypothetical protein